MSQCGVEAWEIHPLHGAAVRRMYGMAVDENLGYKGIADRLHAAGVPTATGAPWSSYSVQRILMNPAMKGTLTYGRRPRKGNPMPAQVTVEGFFPAILSEDEWARLQERLGIRRETSRGHTHSSEYLLSGIARCGHCGGAMAGKVGSRKKGNAEERYRNYWCARALHGKGACDTYNGHSAPRLERAVLEYLGNYSDTDKVLELLRQDEQRDTGRYELEMEGITARLSVLENEFIKNLQLFRQGVMDETQFAKANEITRADRTVLEGRKGEIEPTLAAERDRAALAKAIPPKVRSFFEDFSGMDTQKAKAILQTILKAAHVWKDGRIEVEFR